MTNLIINSIEPEYINVTRFKDKMARFGIGGVINVRFQIRLSNGCSYEYLDGNLNIDYKPDLTLIEIHNIVSKKLKESILSDGVFDITQ
jgi:hypothetical protein